MQAEVLQKIRGLLDKPISALSTRKVTELMEKGVVAGEELLWMFSQKKRGDLIELLLSRYQSICLNKIQALLGSMSQDLLHYGVEQTIKIWLMCMGKEAAVPYRRQWGVEALLRDITRHTNTELKSALLRLLTANVKALWGWKEVKIVEDAAHKYIQLFLKHNIYFAPASELITVFLTLAKETEKDIVPDSIRASLLAHLTELLRHTINRQMHSFQNHSLLAIAALFENGKKGDESTFADMLHLYECQSVIDHYLFRKSTREAARKAQVVVKKTQKIIQTDNAAKMQRVSTSGHKSQVPVLIENVIEKTSEYRQRQKLIDVIQKPAYDSRPKSSFLRRGQGVGGGKAYLDGSVTPEKKKKKQGGVQDLVESCLADKSDSNKWSSSHKASFQELWRQKSAMKGLLAAQEQQERTVELGATTMSVTSTPLEESCEFEEISNLIELAYQYKFG